jgi:hypothetical protein
MIILVAVYCAEAGFPQLKHYQVQIYLNGREWLRRALEKEGVKFFVHGNKFLYIGLKQPLMIPENPKYFAINKGRIK